MKTFQGREKRVLNGHSYEKGPMVNETLMYQHFHLPLSSLLKCRTPGRSHDSSSGLGRDAKIAGDERKEVESGEEPFPKRDSEYSNLGSMGKTCRSVDRPGIRGVSIGCDEKPSLNEMFMQLHKYSKTTAKLR